MLVNHARQLNPKAQLYREMLLAFALRVVGAFCKICAISSGTQLRDITFALEECFLVYLAIVTAPFCFFDDREN